MSKKTTGKVLISIAVAVSAIVSTVVDLLPGATAHVYNTTWPPHAIFHDIVMFLLLDWMALVCLWLLWRKSAEPLVAVRVAVLLVLGFATPFFYVTALFPMAGLGLNPANPDQGAVVIGGMHVYVNVIFAAITTVIALIGYWIYRRGDQAQR